VALADLRRREYADTGMDVFGSGSDDGLVTFFDTHDAVGVAVVVKLRNRSALERR
jgi:hypothetical protein